MVPIVVGGGVGGDKRWAAGLRNEFTSGYSGSEHGSGGWNNNHGDYESDFEDSYKQCRSQRKFTAKLGYFGRALGCCS
uniref:Uncharacterized protein n=1 Tax=Tanacetum cinerariifolium TaxID=118510 RepID=A0A699HNH3_TANCI|nr:hypothetical protein [Tanacetum cinerariifolium]